MMPRACCLTLSADLNNRHVFLLSQKGRRLIIATKSLLFTPALHINARASTSHACSTRQFRFMPVSNCPYRRRSGCCDQQSDAPTGTCPRVRGTSADQVRHNRAPSCPYAGTAHALTGDVLINAGDANALMKIPCASNQEKQTSQML
jgi:hypothetical protein